MLIDFTQAQFHRFDELAGRIQADPEKYLNFDSVSDFYKAAWLQDFPQGTIWTVTGLDDGAEQFDVIIEYRGHFLRISWGEKTTIHCGIYAE